MMKYGACAVVMLLSLNGAIVRGDLTNDCVQLMAAAGHSAAEKYPYFSLLCKATTGRLNKVTTANAQPLIQLEQDLNQSSGSISKKSGAVQEEKGRGYYFVRFGKRSEMHLKRDSKDKSNYDYIRFS